MGHWTPQDLARLASETDTTIDTSQFDVAERIEPSPHDKDKVLKLYTEYKDKKEKIRSEAEVQRAVTSWVRYWREYHESLWHYFAVPNGGERPDGTGAIMALEGVEPGVADMLVLYPSDDHHGLAIEQKVKKNYPSKEQRDFLNRLSKAGFLCCVSWSEEATKQIIVDHLSLPISVLSYP